MLKINIYCVVKNKPVFLFKSGLKLIMWYASRIFRSKKPIHLSKILTVKVLSLAAILACKSLKCVAIAELLMSSFNIAFLCSFILNLSSHPVSPIYDPIYDLSLQLLIKHMLHCIE